ncbi:hypothetical protein BGW80DRAFT_148631 [Lactifluus volemus]|nr:hypothetical protein BGW80DRAFT_148631 [Lactifluus volemus]
MGGTNAPAVLIYVRAQESYSQLGSVAQCSQVMEGTANRLARLWIRFHTTKWVMIWSLATFPSLETYRFAHKKIYINPPGFASVPASH